MSGFPQWRSLAAAVALFAAAGCGSSSSSTPTTPSTPPVATTTITIGASGVTPKDITIVAGSRVLFVNSDSRSHNMASDPHPEHTQCPEINQIGFLSAGQSRETGNFTVARVCGFHDHDNPDSASLKGTITIR
jgi:plastocyanin